MKCLKWMIAVFCVLPSMACETTIDVGNLPTRVTAVGPVEASSLVQFEDGTQGFSQVRIGYALRDFEGDDASVEIEICEEGDESTCGTPFRGFGGDGLSRLPTIPVDTDVAHRYEWEAGCGRIVTLAETDTRYDTNYVARIRVAGTNQEPLQSPSFTLQELGFDPEGQLPCSRDM